MDHEPCSWILMNGTDRLDGQVEFKANLNSKLRVGNVGKAHSLDSFLRCIFNAHLRHGENNSLK